MRTPTKKSRTPSLYPPAHCGYVLRRYYVSGDLIGLQFKGSSVATDTAWSATRYSLVITPVLIAGSCGGGLGPRTCWTSSRRYTASLDRRECASRSTEPAARAGVSIARGLGQLVTQLPVLPVGEC